MNEELKQQAYKEFVDELCNRDKIGLMLHEEQKILILSFIDSLIDKTVQHERERIVGILENEIVELEIWAKVTKNEQDVKEYNFAVFVLKKVLKSLFPNKSDINK